MNAAVFIKQQDIRNQAESMADPSSEIPPSKRSLGSRLANVLRPKKSSTRLVKGAKPKLEERVTEDPSAYSYPRRDVAVPAVPETLQQSVPVNFYNKSPGNTNIQTGETWDGAEMLHSLLRRDSHDSLDSLNRIERMRNEIPDSMRKPGDAMISSLPPSIWQRISSHMTPTDAANLAISSKTLLLVLGTGPFLALNYTKDEEKMREYKTRFLLPMDIHLPNHVSKQAEILPE